MGGTVHGGEVHGALRAMRNEAEIGDACLARELPRSCVAGGIR